MKETEAIEALKIMNLKSVHPFLSWEEMEEVRDLAISALEKQVPKMYENVHGHWEVAIGYDPKRTVKCSECNKMAYEPSCFCPNCGAKMDEEATDAKM